MGILQVKEEPLNMVKLLSTGHICQHVWWIGITVNYIYCPGILCKINFAAMADMHDK